MRGIARSRALATIDGVLSARGLERVGPSEQDSIDPTRSGGSHSARNVRG